MVLALASFVFPVLPAGGLVFRRRAYWDMLLRVFKAMNVTEEDADQAAQIVFAHPPEYADQHSGALVTAIEQVRRDRRDRALEEQRTTSKGDLADRAYNRAVDLRRASISEADRQEWLAVAARHQPRLAAISPVYPLAYAKAWAYEPHTIWTESPDRPRSGDNPFAAVLKEIPYDSAPGEEG